MLAYAIQRIVLFAATLLIASMIVFAVMNILPGDAAQTMLGPTATPEAVAALSHKLGLDQPAPVRYARWIGGALHGDLGLSYAYGSPIGPLIASSLAVSAPLALMAMAFAAAVGLAAGVYAADRRGRAGDAVVMGASQIGIAVPNFWLAILLVIVFAVTLRLVPAGGFPGWQEPARAFGALILPAVALGAVQAAILTRVTRSALIEALNEDFMRTARAKGVSRRAALWRHALPNALTPILTIMGLQFANLIAGAIVVENVFVLPGLGRLMLQSISNRDTLVVENGVMLLALIVIGLNFIVDIACAAIDPRLRAPPREPRAPVSPARRREPVARRGARRRAHRSPRRCRWSGRLIRRPRSTSRTSSRRLRRPIGSAPTISDATSPRKSWPARASRSWSASSPSASGSRSASSSASWRRSPRASSKTGS